MLPHVRKQTRYPPGIPSRFYQGSAHLADNLMLVSESIVQTWATALANVSLADVELQDAEKKIHHGWSMESWMRVGKVFFKKKEAHYSNFFKSGFTIELLWKLVVDDFFQVEPVYGYTVSRWCNSGGPWSGQRWNQCVGPQRGLVFCL